MKLEEIIKREGIKSKVLFVPKNSGLGSTKPYKVLGIEKRVLTDTLIQI